MHHTNWFSRKSVVFFSSCIIRSNDSCIEYGEHAREIRAALCAPFQHSICRAQTMVFKAKYLFSIFQCVERNYGNECTIWCVCVCACACWSNNLAVIWNLVVFITLPLQRRVHEDHWKDVSLKRHTHTHTSYTLTATEHNKLNVSVNFELNTKINKNWKEIEKNRKEK